MQEHIYSFAPIEIYLDHRLTLIELRVLGALFSFRGKHTNTVWPSREALMQRSGYHSDATISRAVTKLKERGWLETKQRRGSNVYEINVPNIESDRTGHSDRSGNSYRTGHGYPLNSDRSSHHTVTDPVTPELNNDLTIKENIKSREDVTRAEVQQTGITKPKSTRAKRATTCPFDPDIFPDDMRDLALAKRPQLNGHANQVWESFVSYHQAKGSAMKDWRAAWRAWFSREQGKAPQRQRELTPHQRSQQRRDEWYAKMRERNSKDVDGERLL